MLLRASRINHYGIVRILLERNVDVNIADDCKETALSVASDNGHDAVVQLLLQTDGIDVNSKDRKGQNALSHALLRNHASTAQLLFTAGAIDGRETSIPANPV